MPLAERKRSKLNPRDLRKVFQRAHEYERDGMGVNPLAHEQQHNPHPLLYTSKVELDTTAGTPLNPLRGGQIVGVRLNVAGAPTGTLTCDLLVDGLSVFSQSPKPTIEIGKLFGYRVVLDKATFAADSKIQVQLTDVGGATGPMVVVIEYLSEF